MEKRLVSICDRLIDYFGWDLEKEAKDYKEKGSRAIKQDEKMEAKVYEAKRNSFNYGLGITSLYNCIESKRGYSACFADYVYAKTPKDFTSERVYHLTTYLNIINEIVELYDEWNNSEFKQAISSLQDHEMFGNEKIGIDPHIVEHIHDLLVKKDQFQLYNYKNTGEEIKSTDKYYISKKIYFSQDLTAYFKHIKNQQEFLDRKKSDEVFITLFGKLDDVHWIHSNWILTLHKGDSIWIMTDQVNFDNPGQKWDRLSRKSVWKDKAEKMGEIDLPYELFEDQSLLRGNTTSLVDQSTYSTKEVNYVKKAEEGARELYDQGTFFIESKHRDIEITRLFQNDLDKYGFTKCGIEINYKHATTTDIEGVRAIRKGRLVGYYDHRTTRAIFYHHPEMLEMETKDLSKGQKLFLSILCNKTLEVIDILKDNLSTIELASDFINRKLIEGGKIDPNNSQMEFWSKHAQLIFNDTNEMLDNEFGKSRALQLKSYALVTTAKQYNASWLATPEKQQSLAEWLVLDKEISPVVNKLRSLKTIRARDGDHRYNQHITSLFEKVDQDKLMNLLFSAERISFQTKEYNQKDSKGECPFRADDIEGNLEAGYVSHLKDDGSVYMKRGYGIFKFDKDMWNEEEVCRSCENSLSKGVRQLHIRHYKLLAYLLGLNNRDELPIYYRNYRAHNMIPYTGNSLLDQTHPYLRLIENDPCSRDSPNGIAISVYLCGRCKNKLLKDKPKELTITI